jgi:hypothetical protein
MGDLQNRDPTESQAVRHDRKAAVIGAVRRHVLAPEAAPAGLPPAGLPREDPPLAEARPAKLHGAANRASDRSPAFARVTPQICIEQAHAAFGENNFEEAIGKYQEAVLLGADPDACAYERWTCWMKLGRLELAWQETDRTEARRKALAERQDTLPAHERRVWNGDSFRDKRVLVRCYHGLGDTIQFARYIPLLSAEAESVHVQAQPQLSPLLRSIRGFAELIQPDKAVDGRDFDIEVELMELPYVFRTRLENIPNDVPYLRVDGEACDRKRRELSQLGLEQGRLNVGLVWSSGDWNRARNIDLSTLKCLAGIPTAAYFSLQRGAAALQLENCRADFHVIQTEHESGELLDTAATITNLDLIITVDTMVAHLAGALGKPVWALLPFCCDWRWMANREDSPWYPTMRLFRQPNRGDWISVVERVRSELTALAMAHHQTSCGSCCEVP